ncbi:DUF4880 domain-containing protein [Pantoea sp. Tr-811]|uniref:FecR/PupR family sigma factor regulator n=1 Tax=Pantoea sp. Tr-811 TaxID=2608361 RepID=UPI00141DC47E|nr:DUF4880 domain-containing protein [Pantoea sp. Tr-811]NIF29046.1 DUF4880 domain-containing protein [Pantoea sp. Tr-811]
MPPPLPDPEDDALLTQAADWCLRLHDGSCTAAERAAFERWVQADARHALEYAKMLEIWDLCDELPRHESTLDTLLTVTSPRNKGVLDS